MAKNNLLTLYFHMVHAKSPIRFRNGNYMAWNVINGLKYDESNLLTFYIHMAYANSP
jgi:hypothetical protein